MKFHKPSKRNLLIAGLIFSGLTCVSSMSSAAVLTGNVADNELIGTAAGDGGTGTGVSQVTTNNTVNGVDFTAGRVSEGAIGAGVFVFELPSLALGESLASVSFTFYNTGVSGPLGPNLDFYGLGYRSASTVLIADYYVGANDTTNATLLQDNIFAAGTTPTVGFHSSSASGNANLTSFLNAQYAAGAQGGNFVFLRINPDAFNTGGRIRIATANNATSAWHPTITYTIIPEPSTGLLLACGGLFLVIRRRCGMRRTVQI